MLGVSQKSLPFDSGFFPPSSVISVLNNPVVKMEYQDNGLTHTVCKKFEKHVDKRFGRGIKFQKSTYNEINSLVESKDMKGINQYIDTTYGYYTLDLRHKFVLAHFNWHKYAKPSKSKGITEPLINIKNINDTLNKRIKRMFDMCNKAKHILFIYDNEPDCNYMMIDDEYFDLQNLEDVRTTVKGTFSAQTFVTTITETNNAEKVLQMINLKGNM